MFKKHGVTYVQVLETLNPVYFVWDFLKINCDKLRSRWL